MTLHNIALVMPDPNTYDIKINELQRSILTEAMNEWVVARVGKSTPSSDILEVGMSLADLLDPDSSTGKLATTGVNSFVL
jgi:hypothetical protein